jgi:hypothetical protein
MIRLLTIAREKMGTRDFKEAGGAFLFVVFPLSLSSPCHKPRLKNISNKIESVRDCSLFYFEGKSVDYMAPKRKEIPPNAYEISSKREESPPEGKEIPTGCDVKPDIQMDRSIKTILKIYFRYYVYVLVTLSISSNVIQDFEIIDIDHVSNYLLHVS